MKMKIQYFAAVAFMALLTFSTSVMAQPDPGGGGDPGGGSGPPVGGGAPIGSGVIILITLALAYGFSRWYTLKKVKTVQE
jgi:hypothetical protein